MYYYTIIHNKTQKHAFHVLNFQECWKDFGTWKFWKNSIRLLRSTFKFFYCLMKSGLLRRSTASFSSLAFWDTKQDSQDGNKEFGNLGRRGRPAEAWMKYSRHNLYIIIIFCRFGINLSWDGLIIVVNSVGSRRARQETIKALAENHKINLNISKQIEEMRQIKKRVKTGHKRTGTKTSSDIKRKKTGQARLVKLCRPHYLFLQVESKGITPNKDFISRILWKTIISPPIKA